MPVAPAASCAIVVIERTRVTTSTPESPGIPARNGFNGLCRALPGDRAVLPPSSADIVLSKPGWADATPQNLTPASGRQDHTILPYAATSLVRSLGDRSQVSSTRPAIPSRAKRCRVHRIPPRVRDDRDTPLCVGWDAKSSRGDLGCVKTEIFLQRGLDTPVNKPPDGQITTRQREQIPLVSRTRCSVLHAAPQSRDP